MFSVVAAPVINKFEALVLAPVTVQGWCSVTRGIACKDSTKAIRKFVITEKAPNRAFSWLKAATTAFTFGSLTQLS